MSKGHRKPRRASSRSGAWPVLAGVVITVVLSSVIYGLRSRARAPVADLPVGSPSGPRAAMSQVAPDEPAVPVGNATAPAVDWVTGGARLAADYSRLDFGFKNYGEPVNARFKLTNVGDSPLTIADVSVKTMAGC